MKTKLLDENYHPGPRWLIVSLAPSEIENDSFGNERIIAKDRRPKYLHETFEEAEKEALRLASLYGGYQRAFVIFEAVAFTEKRRPFEIAAQTVNSHRAGASLRDIQEHLGHSHLNTTMIYITPDPTPIRSPYETLGLTL